MNPAPRPCPMTDAAPATSQLMTCAKLGDAWARMIPKPSVRGSRSSLERAVRPPAAEIEPLSGDASRARGLEESTKLGIGSRIRSMMRNGSARPGVCPKPERAKATINRQRVKRYAVIDDVPQRGQQ